MWREVCLESFDLKTIANCLPALRAAPHCCKYIENMATAACAGKKATRLIFLPPCPTHKARSPRPTSSLVKSLMIVMMMAFRLLMDG